ncbi:MAG: hypothetical protein ACRD5L_16380, partial [Bryobacteraceae bacterium]
MGSENFKVMEELKSLDRQVGIAGELAELKPIFYRLEEIARQYTDDFEVQLAVGDVKQRLVTRGAKLKERRDKLADISSLPPTVSMVAVPDPPPVAPPVAGPPHLPTSPVPVPPVPVLPPGDPFATPESTAPPIHEPSPPGPPAPTPQVPSARSSLDWKRAIGIGALGGLAAIVAIVLLVNLARKLNSKPPAPAAEVAVDVVTVPPGASVRVNNDETKCTSNCNFSLPP